MTELKNLSGSEDLDNNLNKSELRLNVDNRREACYGGGGQGEGC